MNSIAFTRLRLRRLSDILCLGVLISLPWTSPAWAQETDRPIDLDRAADYFAESRALEGRNPWPDSLHGPMLFVDRATRFVVASVRDANDVLEPSDGVFVGTLPPEVGIANTAVDWAGTRWTMLIWPPPAGRYARGVLMAHELFHGLSPQLGLEMSSPTNEHLDSADGRIWLRLELRALARSLVTRGRERRNAVLDALRFRARRHATFAAAAEEEAALERNEGLAEYTGVHASLGPAGRAGWTARLVEEREVQAAGGSVSRNFAYATGPAYGLLLDAVRPDWEREVDSDFDLAASVGRAYDADPFSSLAASAPTRIAEYDGVALKEFERAREAAREERLATWRERFVEGPVLRLPADSAFGYGFDPNAIATMGNIGQVLMGGHVRGGWGSLEMEGDVLLQRVDGSVVGAVVPAPDDPEARPVSGDGWVLQLDEDWELVPGTRPGDWTVRPVGS